MQRAEISPSSSDPLNPDSWSQSQESEYSRRRSLLRALFILGAICISVVISVHYLPLVLDDSLIGYRYSERLVHGGGLTWNDGEYVEGYSNLLWLLLIAFGGLFQPNLVEVGWVFGLLANIATLVSMLWAFGRGPNNSDAATLIGILLIACSESFAFWGISGLETALVCALMSWALATVYRAPPDGIDSKDICASLLFGLLSISRPDGALFGVSVAIGELIRSGATRNAIKRATLLSSSAVIFVLLQTLFRLAYYGSAIPNVASAKLALTVDRILGGGSYVLRGAVVNGAILAVIVGCVIVSWRTRRYELLRRNAIFLLPATIWLSYVCGIGGDFFPFERHWQPAFICLTFAASGAIAMLKPIRFSVLAILLPTCVALHIAAQSTVNPYALQFPKTDTYWKTLQQEIRKVSPSGEIERELSAGTPKTRGELLRQYQRGYQDCAALGKMLGAAFRSERPLIAVNVAGCLPYFSKLPAVDMLGLTDSHIAHHRPPDIGQGLLAHELGDGAYVLSRKPDLLAFCTGDIVFKVVPCFRGDRELAVSQEFQKDYRLVFYRSGRAETELWTRIEDGRLAIERSEGRILIPGFLFATTETARAIQDSGGKLVTALQNGNARVENIDFPPGKWDISLRTGGTGHLSLTTLPYSPSTATMSPTDLHITSRGEKRSFSVSGDKGIIYALIATRDAGSVAHQP